MSEKYKNKIRKFYSKNRRMPSYSELAGLVGFASKNAAYELADKLVDEGFLSRDSSGKLLPRSIYEGVRRLGVVEAGFPTPAEEELVDTMNLDEWLIGNRESTYILEVKGDSMIGAGINEGDLVIVERTNKYGPGDIVIADVDGEWTMKYLRSDKNGHFLEAANKKYKPIRPGSEMLIAAVVRGVVRKY